MGRLAGFGYEDIARKLRRAGFVFDRHAKGSHEIWWNPKTRARVMIPHHTGDLPQGTVRAIIREASIPPEEFLRL